MQILPGTPLNIENAAGRDDKGTGRVTMMQSLTLVVWSTALGLLLWGSGMDLLIQELLKDNYSQAFNNLTRTLGVLGLGRTLVWLCLAGGVLLAVWAQGVQRLPQVLLAAVWGCVAQVGWWLRGQPRWPTCWQALPKTNRLVLLAVPVLGVAGLVQILLKGLVGRGRPKEVLWNGWDPYQVHPAWLNWHFEAGFMSFPSGHSCSTWAVAVVLAAALPRWRWLIYTLAVAASAARFLALTPHYLGDVVAGGGLGAAVGLFFVRWMLAAQDRQLQGEQT